MATRAGVYWFTTLLLSGAPRFTSQRFLVAVEYVVVKSVHRRVLSETVVYVVHCAGTAWPAPKVKQHPSRSTCSACGTAASAVCAGCMRRVHARVRRWVRRREGARRRRASW